MALLPTIFLVSLLTVLPNQANSGYDYKRIFEIAFLLTILLLTSFSNTNLRDHFNKKTKTILGLLFFLGILSSLLSENHKFAFIELITFFAIFIATIHISAVWNARGAIVNAVFALTIGFFLLEVKFYAYYLAFIFSGNQFSIHEFFPSFSNARFFNQYQIWTLPFLTLILTEQGLFKKINKKLLTLIAINWWLMFFTTGSRGAIVAVTVAFVVILFFFRDKAFAFIKATLLFALSGFILYQVLFHLIPYLINLDAESLVDSLEIRINTSDRFFVWVKAFYFAVESPVLGIGPMHFAWYDINDLTHINRLNHPHNSVLQWGAEWGLISLFLVMFLFVQACKGWFKKFNYKTIQSNNDALIIALTFSSVSAISYSLFSGVVVMPVSQLMGVFIFSMMFAVCNIKTIQIKENKLSFNLLLIPVAIFYFYLLIPDIIQIMFIIEDSIDIDRPAPRFWVSGNIY